MLFVLNVLIITNFIECFSTPYSQKTPLTKLTEK